MKTHTNELQKKIQKKTKNKLLPIVERERH